MILARFDLRKTRYLCVAIMAFFQMFMKIQNSISHITESDNQIWISLNIYPAFDLSGGIGRRGLGGLTPLIPPVVEDDPHTGD